MNFYLEFTKSGFSVKKFPKATNNSSAVYSSPGLQSPNLRSEVEKPVNNGASINNKLAYLFQAYIF